MEELEVLLKEQEQQKITIGNYKAMIAGYSRTIKELHDQHFDFKSDYNDVLKEYDTIKNSTKPVDQVRVTVLKSKMATIDAKLKNISSNLQSNKLNLDTAKTSLQLEELKNKTLQKQIADHPETKLVSAEEKEKIVNDTLQNARDTKAKIGKILEGEIKSMNDIPNDIKQKLFKDNSTLTRYDKELAQLNTDLNFYKKSKNKDKDRFIKPIEQKIKTIENRKLSFAINELEKANLASDVVINTCYSHMKNLTLEKAKAYTDIDDIHNGTYKQPENDEHSDNDNKGSQSKDDDEKFKDDENDEKAKTGLPIKPSFFNRFKNKLSEIINKVKEYLPKSKAKKEQEEKEAEEQRKQEEEQKQKEEQEQKEKEQKEKEQKEKEQNENKNQKTNNRHYEAKDFKNNQNFKNDMDEFLKNFEARTKKDVKDFEKDYDDNSFNR